MLKVPDRQGKQKKDSNYSDINKQDTSSLNVKTSIFYKNGDPPDKFTILHRL